MPEVEYLRERAEEFYDNAKYNISRGFYNLAAFCIEQFMQLYLKYLLAKSIGYYPRTHSLSELFKDAGRLCKELLSFYEKRALEISSIEDAYISSRYLPRKFDKQVIEAMYKLAEEFKEVIKKCLQQ